MMYPFDEAKLEKILAKMDFHIGGFVDNTVYDANAFDKHMSKINAMVGCELFVSSPKFRDDLFGYSLNEDIEEFEDRDTRLEFCGTHNDGKIDCRIIIDGENYKLQHFLYYWILKQHFKDQIEEEINYNLQCLNTPLKLNHK